MHSPKTNKILAVCKNEIRKLSKSTIENIWKIGEYLSIAKEAIIMETGDGRATGFLEWVEKEFGFSSWTASRMMKAYRDKITDLTVIWDNEKNGYESGLAERSSRLTSTKSLETRKLPKHSIHFLIHIETSNKIMIDVLESLKKEEYEDTVVHSFETSLGWCQKCGEPLEKRESDVCESCQKVKSAEKPMVRQEARA